MAACRRRASRDDGPPNATQGLLQAELARLIGNHLRAGDQPSDVLVNPGVVPATMSVHNMRVPDLAVSYSPVERAQAAPSDPLLIVEILSPGNRADNWANVWAYTPIASVREILILRADAIGGDVLRRRADGSWPDRTAPMDDWLSLESIGFRKAASQLYARTPLEGG